MRRLLFNELKREGGGGELIGGAGGFGCTLGGGKRKITFSTNLTCMIVGEGVFFSIYGVGSGGGRCFQWS